ncbi:uncharacterized protein BXZ73DRAFT_110193 [Epithele typhae]|uniref:uncharacterized protein n=1 Tax=Epithele typhae TaxID=378194 RepID=UPI0020089FB8|nr:uncharacterized protein BXZ73DRAFT_110193 [Epithele typhae]KAH9907654.1 hypothetical protein BXZ73DRAFT_110193 [Epithele typhae]
MPTQTVPTCHSPPVLETNPDEAKRYLDVLLLPQFESYNKPQWAARIVRNADPDHSAHWQYTTHALFAAMYATAEPLGMDRGRRYVSDTIRRHPVVAVAVQAYADDGRASTPDTPTSPEDADAKRSRAYHLRRSVLLRDGHKCCFSGVVDDDAPKDLKSHAKRLGEVRAAHILNLAPPLHDRGSVDAEESLRNTLAFLTNFCLVEEPFGSLIEALDGPLNAFLLWVGHHSDFDRFKWCLRATKTRDCYDICYMPDSARYKGARTALARIAFQDHHGGVDLPSPGLLRIHCAVTHVLHLSGALELFQELCLFDGSDYETGPAAHVAPTGAAFIAHVVDEDPYAVMELRESLAAMLSPQ